MELRAWAKCTRAIIIIAGSSPSQSSFLVNISVNFAHPPKIVLFNPLTQKNENKIKLGLSSILFTLYIYIYRSNRGERHCKR